MADPESSRCKPGTRRATALARAACVHGISPCHAAAPGARRASDHSSDYRYQEVVAEGVRSWCASASPPIDLILANSRDEFALRSEPWRMSPSPKARNTSLQPFARRHAGRPNDELAVHDGLFEREHGPNSMPWRCLARSSHTEVSTIECSTRTVSTGALLPQTPEGRSTTIGKPFP